MTEITHGIRGKDDACYWIEQIIDRGLISMHVRRDAPKGLPWIGHLYARIVEETILLDDIYLKPSVRKHPKKVLWVVIPTKEYPTRNLGIGSALIEELKKRARQEKAAKIEAELFPKDLTERPDLADFYKKQGFVQEAPNKFTFHL